MAIANLRKWIKALHPCTRKDKTMTLTDEDFDIIAFNGVTGDCLTTDDVDPILYLPTYTPSFERGIWEAVLESPGRDWTDTEREYLRRNDGIRESIMQWAEFNYSEGCWTEANLELLRPYGKASADSLDGSSTDITQTTEVNNMKDF